MSKKNSYIFLDFWILVQTNIMRNLELNFIILKNIILTEYGKKFKYL